MKIRTLVFFALAMGFYAVSHSLELRGDAAPLAESGVSAERAGYHIAALIMLLGAIGCLIGAGISIFRKAR